MEHSIIDQEESQIGTFHQITMGESKWNQGGARSGAFYPRSRREGRGKPETEHSIIDQGRGSQREHFMTNRGKSRKQHFIVDQGKGASHSVLENLNV